MKSVAEFEEIGKRVSDGVRGSQFSSAHRRLIPPRIAGIHFALTLMVSVPVATH